MFRRLARLSRPVAERVHGDAVTIYPVAQTGGVNAPRVGRADQGYDTVACFFENTLIENEAQSRPLTGAGRTVQAAPGIYASITIRDGHPIQSGFYMLRIHDSALYEIGQFKPDGLGGVYAMLNVAQSIPGVTDAGG